VTGDFGLFGVVEDETITGYADPAYWQAKIRTTEDGQTVSFGRHTDRVGTDYLPIDWGDGTMETYYTGSIDAATHTYATAGDYTVTFRAWFNASLFWVFPKEELVGLVVGALHDQESYGQQLKSNGFQNYTNLETVSFPHSLRNTGYSTFRECTKLTEIILPSGVTQVAAFSFRDCTSVTTIDIPETVTTLNDSCFRGCTATTSITMRGLTPPSHSGVNHFMGTNSAPIYVPAESIDTYKVVWASYKNRIQAIE
jgi:hypothetical protein